MFESVSPDIDSDRDLADTPLHFCEVSQDPKRSAPECFDRKSANIPARRRCARRILDTSGAEPASIGNGALLAAAVCRHSAATHVKGHNTRPIPLYNPRRYEYLFR